jgi:predicted  nucleic acid-binding Zn-ribbon protein
MAHRCLDCGYRSKKGAEAAGFPAGRCPACGSANIAKTATGKFRDDLKQPKTKIEIAILVLFWAVLIYGIWDRYL